MPSRTNAAARNPALTPEDPGRALFDSYSELFGRLLEVPAGLGFFDHEATCTAHRGKLRMADASLAIKQLLAHPGRSSLPAVHEVLLGREPAAILVMQDSQGRFLGALVVQVSEQAWRSWAPRPGKVVATRLKPALELLQRQMRAVPAPARVQVLEERTQELEWLFSVSSRLSGTGGDDQQLGALLQEASERIGAAFAGIVIPEKRINVVHATQAAGQLAQSFSKTSSHLLNWVQRRAQPLVVNSPPKQADALQSCRVLAVPVVQKSGRVLGLLAFFNPVSGCEFASRHVYLARHLGRQVATMLEAQFDLATGLYTRAALEQKFGKCGPGDDCPEGSVIYFDIDRLHLVNEVHGFEIGDEVIVRIADLLAPPLVPAGALSARISGDRFAIILRQQNPDEAMVIAGEIQSAVARIRIGPEGERSELSLSCGIAALIDVPQALPRALAAAELACKMAKDRGRGRTELYATADSSMMRRQDDVLAVGRLRAALKSDRLMLYAQRIEPLQGKDRPFGYEILVRMRDEDGNVIAPGEFISAAQRYQLLPSIDRWVVERSLRQLAPFAGLLRHREISMSINVSGQSVGDPAFMQRFAQQLGESGIAPSTITVEITEQTAVSNVARAIEMVRSLRQLGCRLALDDFGTGVNSLTYLKGFPITRVKIDGSFIRDLLTDAKSEETVKAIVQLAKGMQIDTVAEFVENEELARKVRRMGIDYAQGYAFGRPEPLERILDQLQHDEDNRPHRFEFEI